MRKYLWPILVIALALLVAGAWVCFPEERKAVGPAVTSFCNSFIEEQFSNLSTPAFFALSAGMITLFFVAYAIMGVICRALRFNREDTITALFCGSKKSLVHGAVMSQIILTDPAMAGILLLPTMLYHALQLIIVSILARRWAVGRP